MQRQRWTPLGVAAIALVAWFLWWGGPRGSSAADLRLLFVGNSYTYGNGLPTLVKELMQRGIPAYRDVFVQQYAKGGWRLEQHRQDAESATGGSPLREYLVTGQNPNFAWDFVLLQEQSQIPAFPQTDSYWQGSLNGLRGLHQLVQKKGATSVLLMTWGRRKGDTQNPGLFPDYKTMQARLKAGYLAYAAQVGTAQAPVFIAPAGLAWERIYDEIAAGQNDPTADGTLFSRLYAGDGSHPSLLGSYLTACVIVGALTGFSMASVAWSPNDAIPASERSALQAIAFATVWKGVFSTFRYPWTYEWTSYPWPQAVTPTGKAISGVSQFPLVRLSQDAGTLASLRLGVKHGAGVGHGRLWIEDGARLTITDELHIGHDGQGHVVQRGGTVKAAALVLGQGTSASYLLRGGTLEVQTLRRLRKEAAFSMVGGRLVVGAADRALTLEGGALEPGPGVARLTLAGDLSIGAPATLAMDVSAPSQGEGKGADLVDSQGVVTIAGTLQVKSAGGVSLAPGQSLVLVRAQRIVLSQGWTWNAPSGWRWSVRKANGREELFVALAGSSEPGEAVGEGSSSDAAPPQEASPEHRERGQEVPSEAGNPSDASALETPNPPQQGCCQVSEEAPLWLWTVALALGVWGAGRRRRRRA